MLQRPSRWRRKAALAVTAALAAPLLALSATAPSLAASGPDQSQGRNVAQQLDVATYNIYLGADLSPLFVATGFEDLVARAAGVYAQVQQTDFPERSRTLARLIAHERPDVIGLQEVGLWETAPFDPFNPAAEPDYSTTYDFLATLQADLAAANVPYRAVATNRNFSSRDLGLTIPISMDTQAAYTDRDVILIRELPGRERLTATDPRSGIFQARVPINLLGETFPVVRGWSSVDVNKGGLEFRFYNTHLEAFDGVDGPIKIAQATELAADIEKSTLPVVVVGDVNSRPTGCNNINTVSYSILEDAAGGLDEVWPVAVPRDPCGGDTSGQDADLLNAESTLDHRIDVIFYDPERFRARKTDVIGDEQRDRTPESNLWPSDHAGSVATLRTLR
jgi:endonuclease/exonuclease/phosphatase family metal-dependent hydrolase